jgi:hypothetical protein
MLAAPPAAVEVRTFALSRVTAPSVEHVGAL